jgi:hypothetical protein
VAVSVIRCCGRGWSDRTCTPSRGRVRGRTTTGFGVLAAVCLLALSVQVETAGAAEAPPPPLLIPPVPTIAVDVSVSIPSVSVSVQVGGVAVSIVTAPVDVSVTTSTTGTVSSTAAPAAAEQTTPNDDSGDCCVPAEAEATAPPAATAARARRPARASPPERAAPPRTRAAVSRVRAYTIRTPRVERPTRSLTTTKVSRRESERPATHPKARRGSGEHAQPAVLAVARTHAGPPPGVRLALDRRTGAAARPAASRAERATDNRLLLQLGVLAAFLYLVCLAAWYSATRPSRRRA